MKHFIFEHYGWMALFSVLLGVGVFYVAEPSYGWQLLTAWISGTFSFVFFVQRQALEETKMFNELFTEFNKRYDQMNEVLNRIIERERDEELSADERDCLNNYFNLCAEEYLFYRRGFIYGEAWQAWRNGMEFFLRHPRVRKHWEQEASSDSYYGLRLE